MGCGSCGTKTKDGKPSGCKSNGGCSSGGCNRMNVHNWLSDLPISDIGKPYPIVELSFNNGSRKDFYKNTTLQYFEKGDFVVIESSPGFDVGVVSLTGELVKLQMAKRGIKEDSDEIKKILRMANEEEVQKMDEAKSKEKAMLIRSRAVLSILKLDMKLTEVELQADQKKAIFYYIAEDRIDYRELIKVYARDFNVKVEMRQIGIRQEAAKVGGIGSCGRELCCSTWLTDFKGVSTTAARYQNLSINQTKLSGQCGRLKCCLNFELDTYMDALKGFPDNADKLELATGSAYLQKKDIFKNVMWYTLSGSNKQYPLSIERAKEIKQLNAKGEKPNELGFVELEPKKGTVVEEAYVDLVGAISLQSLDKAARKNKQGNKKPSGPGGNNNPNRGPKPNNNPNAKGPDSNRPPNPNQGNKPQGKRPPNPNQQNKPQGNAEPKAAPQILAPKAAPQILAPKPAPQVMAEKPKPNNPPNPNAAKPNAEGGHNNPNKKFKSNYGGKKPPKDGDKPQD
jgi:cell fate regulator YaaT (PSP1 superfamily)